MKTKFFPNWLRTMTVFIMLLAALAPVTSAHAQDPYPCLVTSNLDDFGVGTLRNILEYTGCETITFDGDYDIVLDSTFGPLVVDLNDWPYRNVTIDGTGHTVTVSGGGLVRVFEVHSGVSFNLQNLSVVDGYAAADATSPLAGGGGMMIDRATVNITDVTFSGSQALVSGSNAFYAGGGGILSYDSNLALTDVTFVDNSTDAFGGGLASFGNTVTLTRVNFQNNTGDVFGGGMVSLGDDSVTLTGVTFSGNSSPGVPEHGPMLNGWGGGLLLYTNVPTLTNVVFSGNTARMGGGLAVMGPSATLTNVIFDGNSALGAQVGSQEYPGAGGGMLFWGDIGGYSGGGLSLTNATFSGNSALVFQMEDGPIPGTGGGMWYKGDADSVSTLTNATFSGNSANEGSAIWADLDATSSLAIQNSILWGNDNVISLDLEMSVEFTVGYSDVQGGWEGEGSINSDPLFLDATNGDLHLQAGSPALDAGDQTLFPAGVTTDLDGNPRVDGGNVDMGAYEFQSIPADTTPPVVTVTGVSEGATYILGAVPAAGCSTTDEGSGVATEATLSLTGGNSLGVGSWTATCSGAMDNAGNIADPVSVDYSVTFLFTGFFSPVDNNGVLNIAKAGQIVPLKFRITDANGNPITTLTGVTVTAVSLSCSVGTSTDLIEEYATGSSGLQNLGDGYYQWNWKTPSSYANSCKTMKLDLGEGLFHTALFQFKK
jgi:hypothetical protein